MFWLTGWGYAIVVIFLLGTAFLLQLVGEKIKSRKPDDISEFLFKVYFVYIFLSILISMVLYRTVGSIITGLLSLFQMLILLQHYRTQLYRWENHLNDPE